MNKGAWDDVFIALGMTFIVMVGVAILVGAVGGIWFLCTIG